MLIYIYILITIIVLFYGYRHTIAIKQFFFIHPATQLLLLSLVYLLLPALIIDENYFKLIAFDDSIYVKLYKYSLYYHSIFLINFIVSIKFSKVKFKFNFNLSSKSILYLKCILFLASFYLLLIIVFKVITFGPSLFSLSRTQKYDFYLMVKSFPGFTFFSFVVLIWAFVVGISRKVLFPVFFLLPLVLLEIICSSRLYIYDTFILFSLLFVNKYEKELNFKYLLFIGFSFIVVSFFRDGSGDLNNNFITILISSSGEFINTYTSTGLLIENNYESNLNPILYSLQYFFPSSLLNTFSMKPYNINDYLSTMHDFEFGIGSSVLLEGIAFGKTFFYLFPIIVSSFFTFLYNKITSSSIVLFYLFLLNIFSVFRGSFLINIGVSIYMFLFLFLFPLFIMYKFEKNE